MLLVEAPILTGLLAMLSISVMFAPDSHARLSSVDASFPSILFCPFLELTGLPCLFCGMTRSWMAMGGLDMGEALRFHPLGPALFALTAMAGLYLALSLALKKRLVIRASGRLWLSAAGVITALVLMAWPLKLVLWNNVGLL